MKRRTQPRKRVSGKMASQQLVHHICEIEVSPRLQLKFVYKTSEDEGEHISLQLYHKVPQIGPIDPKPNSHILLPVAAANDLKKVLNDNLGRVETKDLSYQTLRRSPQREQPCHSSIDAKKVIMALADPITRKHWDHQDPAWAIKTGLVYHGLKQKLNSAIFTLEHLLESNASEESKYQQWAEENLWAFGNYYVNIDSDRNLSKRKVVDLPVQNIRGYIDIIELKTPQPTVLKRIPREHKDDIWCFTHEVSEAIAQCAQYLSRYHNAGGHHPRATIVIGRSKKEPEWRAAIHSLNAHMHNIYVMTFDDLLAQARQSLEALNTHLKQSWVAQDQATSQPIQH